MNIASQRPDRLAAAEAVEGEVRLSRHGQHLHVEPPCADVQKALRTRVRCLARYPAGPYTVRAVPVELYQVEDEVGSTVLRCLAGLELAVRRLLERAGVAVRVVGRRPGPLPTPTPSRTWTFEQSDGLMIDCVQRCERARIRYDSEMVDPAFLVAQIARAWPHHTILVLAAQRAEVPALRRRLRRHQIDAAAVTGQHGLGVGARVAVATYGAIAHPALAAEWRDIVVVLHGVEAVGEKARYCLGYAGRARWYALVADGVQHSPYEEDILTDLFGFQEVFIPRHSYHESSVEVVRCRVEGGPFLSPDLDGFGLKRRGLWWNAMRNRRVARLARLLLDGQIEPLRELYPVVARALSCVKPAGVVVLVENVDHGLALVRMLPGWPLITAPSTDAHGLSAKDVAVLSNGEQAKEQRPRFAVVTAAGMDLIRLPRPDVVVRADGGVGLPTLGSLQFVQPNWEPPRRLLLVDFEDRHHPVLREWSRSRMDAYEKRGWFAPGVDPVLARVDRFLASRPTEVKR